MRMNGCTEGRVEDMGQCVYLGSLVVTSDDPIFFYDTCINGVTLLL
jgi:hypothetical protein